MKRLLALCLALSVMITTFLACDVSVFAEFDSQETLSIYRSTKFADITAPAYEVYDCDNKQVLTGKAADEKRPVASLTKLMTVYIVYEYVRLGKIQLTDMVTTSANAADTEGATAFISAGDTFSVYSGLYAVIISSCNDVTVALAEHIAGSEEEFVKLMNSHATALGMSNTQFVDCTGINDAGYSTAHDMVLLSEAMILNHPEYMDIATISYDTETFQNSGGPFYMYNTNKFIRFVPDSDGLKIGSTLGSMYCISATYVVDGRRFIVVLLGASDENVLYAETRRAFDYCFANYYYAQLQEDGEFVMDLKVTKGVEKEVGCAISGEFGRVVTQEERDGIEKRTELPESLEAPVKKGDKVGTVKYYLGEEVIHELDIIATEDVERASWFQILIQWLLEWFGFI